MTRILYADDEERFRDLVEAYLKKESFEVVLAPDGRQALEAWEEAPFDLVILDVMMPRIDGWSVLRSIREDSDVPVIMLTARDEEHDELFGFELGADEYIAKPFSPKILVARIERLLKRGATRDAERLETDGIRIDLGGHRVHIDDSEVAMSPKEFDLLVFFMRNPGLAITRERLLDVVWGYDYYGDLRTVDTHIKRLRTKLGTQGDRIETVRGVGYRFANQS